MIRTSDATTDAAYLADCSADELEALKRFRLSLGASEAAKLSDRILMRFLRARALDEKKARALIDQSFAFAAKHPILPEHVALVRRLNESKMWQWTPHHSHANGAVLTYLHAKNLPAAQPDLMVGLPHCHLAAIMQHALGNALPSSEKEGWALVVDFADSSYKSWMAIGASEIKFLLETIQTALPLRLRAIAIVHAPWWASIIIALVKQFLEKELAQLIHNVSEKELAKEVGEANLLASCGGAVPDNSDDANALFEAALASLFPSASSSSQSPSAAV